MAGNGFTGEEVNPSQERLTLAQRHEPTTNIGKVQTDAKSLNGKKETKKATKRVQTLVKQRSCRATWRTQHLCTGWKAVKHMPHGSFFLSFFVFGHATL